MSSTSPKVRTGRRVTSAIGTAVVIVTVVLAVGLVAFATGARKDAHGVTRFGGRPVLTVLSGSMTPTFRPGDLVIDHAVSPDRAQHLTVGTIITYRPQRGALVTHRIIDVRTAGSGVTYRTQGDANNVADAAPVTPAQVVGTYSSHLRYAGYALRAAKSKGGLFLLVFVPILALITKEIGKRWDSGDADQSQRRDPIDLPVAEPLSR